MKIATAMPSMGAINLSILDFKSMGGTLAS